MSVIYVDETIELMAEARGYSWDCLAEAREAELFILWALTLLRLDPPVVSFQSRDVWYSPGFFTRLFQRIHEEGDEMERWMVQLLRQSDLDQDPELVRRVREGVA